jgi:hypothetical protein
MGLAAIRAYQAKRHEVRSNDVMSGAKSEWKDNRRE